MTTNIHHLSFFSVLSLFPFSFFHLSSESRTYVFSRYSLYSWIILISGLTYIPDCIIIGGYIVIGDITC
jgi:hypothetical protein